MELQHYIQSGNKLLRCGYTTGTCATLASKACTLIHFTATIPDIVTITTPKGIDVTAQVLDVTVTKNTVTCAIKKDAGDDIDATDGMLIYTTVTFTNAVADTSHVTITGGTGIGVVTKPGLNQPVGEHAINSTPRKMITDTLTQLAKEYDYKGSYHVKVFAPDGERIAKRTFNANLGILGGISILGTTGIVEPQSLQALLDSIKVEVAQHNANGEKRVILTFGNYGVDFIGENIFDVLTKSPQIKISNFVGDTLDSLTHTNIKEIILVGHIGKVVKLAGGIMNTHSKIADCRTEIFAVHSTLNGATIDTVQQIMDSATTDACIEILDQLGIREQVISDIIASASRHLNRRVNDDMKVGLITFSNKHGLLHVSDIAKDMVN